MSLEGLSHAARTLSVLEMEINEVTRKPGGEQVGDIKKSNRTRDTIFHCTPMRRRLMLEAVLGKTSEGSEEPNLMMGLWGGKLAPQSS